MSDPPTAGVAADEYPPALAGDSPLENTLGVISIVLMVVLVVEAVAGIITGLRAQLLDAAEPTAARIVDGAQWAGVASGLAALAAVALVAIPRLALDRPWSNRARNLLVAGAVVAALTATAAATGTVAFFVVPGSLSDDALGASVLFGGFAISAAALGLAVWARPSRIADGEDWDEAGDLDEDRDPEDGDDPDEVWHGKGDAYF